MATVQDVMNRSLKLLVVAGAEADIESSDASDFIFALNNYMQELESQQYVDTTVTPNVTYGINFDWSDVSSTSDEVSVGAGGLRGLCACMAYEMAPEYGVTVTPELDRLYRDGHRALLRVGRNLQDTEMPTTLPIGSGNEDDGTNYGSGHFYPTE